MATIAIKNVSDELHEQLKNRAKENHRTIGQEALIVLELGLNLTRKRKLPPPVKLNFLLTNKMINAAKRKGRA